MKAKITRVSKSDTSKDGVKLVSKKDGKPYFKIGIQIEGSDEWINGFANNTSDPRYNLTEGGSYSIAVSETRVGDKVYKNFRMLKPEEIEMEEMRDKLAKLEGQQPTSTTSVAPEASPEVDLDTF